jgi:hypothetical protein
MFDRLRVSLRVNLNVALDVLVVTANGLSDHVAGVDAFTAPTAGATVGRPESVIDFDGLPIDIAHFDRLGSCR